MMYLYRCLELRVYLSHTIFYILKIRSTRKIAFGVSKWYLIHKIPIFGWEKLICTREVQKHNFNAILKNKIEDFRIHADYSTISAMNLNKTIYLMAFEIISPSNLK